MKDGKDDTIRFSQVTHVEDYEKHLKNRKRVFKFSADVYDDLFPEKKQEKTDSATMICQHIFDLLSSGPKELSRPGDGYEPIDWHKDYKSGYRWDQQTLHSRIPFGDKPGVDIKVPWELSRFQHLTLLGQAYVLTENKAYADEFRNQIDDWIKNNRVGFGVNWASTMDVAIRAANWLVAQEYFYGKPVLSEDFWPSFFLSIYDHGRFIRRHLEKGPPKANHYLSNIVGLFFIALYCPFFKESDKWRRFCMRELEREIKRQVYDDGCNFEGSTAYHRLALELFFYSDVIAQRCGFHFSSAYSERLKKMFIFSLYCLKPDGRIPQIGDNDNGRFLIFSSRLTLDHAYLLSLAAIHFQDPNFKLKNVPFDEEAFWVFGKEGHGIWKDLPYREEELRSKAFPNAGWYIMRHKNHYCFVSCGPSEHEGKGAHTHNDRLSFELMLNGEDIVVDPGTYVYTPFPEWRNRFRSTSFHNTVQIDRIEQNDISGDLFEMVQGTKSRKCELTETDNAIVFTGTLEYHRTNITHKRNIVMDNDGKTCQIDEKILSDMPHILTLNLCLGNGAGDYDISLQNGFFVEIDGAYSREYGHKEGAIFLRSTIDIGTDFTNKIRIRKR
ncbi:MAG: alginate lyase family protein [Deltaproteobacteria bacterium]|nr:alginate lyase family protein [Deltaproteobacteria bacterium]